MLVSIIERFQQKGERDIDRYARWSAAIEQLRDDFVAGDRPTIGQLRDYLEELPDDQQSEGLQDLVAEHLRLAWRSGSGPKLEAYLDEYGGEFSEFASPAALPADLVEDEFLARYQSPYGDMPPVAEYEKRFPDRPAVTGPLESRFFGNRRLVRMHKCGQGAAGAVWEAFDLDSGNSIAVKEPGADHPDPAETLRHFANEVSVTAGLEDRGIVSLRRRPRQDGETPLYTMRLVTGENLSDRIGNYHFPSSDRTSRGQAILRDELLRSFAAICDALSFAHAGGVIHRDLKPGNVIMEESGDAAILDWGFATRLEPEDRQSIAPALASREAVVGTPAYMPPEQAGGFSDTLSDVFSLGAILYEILTGRPPDDCTADARAEEWMPVIRKADISAPRTFIASIPKTLEAICMKALARDPGDRYESAAQFAEDVRSYLAGKPVSARTPPVLSRLWKVLRGG